MSAKEIRGKQCRSTATGVVDLLLLALLYESSFWGNVC
jgi:hypothetical protein